MAQAVGACVHCGFCLPTCPTYVELGEEMDSPRGRIVLMQGMLEGEIDLAEGLPYVDRCLGCVACETSCPSGVEYGALLGAFRARAEKLRRRPFGEAAVRRLLLATLAHPRILRLAARGAFLGRWIAGLLPSRLAQALELLPADLPVPIDLPTVTPAQGECRARVVLWPSCAQRVLAPEIDAAAVRVLARAGVEVVVPRGLGCCGALAAHAGEEGLARGLNRRALDSLSEELAVVDAVLTTAAGCGSALREGGALWAGQPEETLAREVASKVRDITSFLHTLGVPTPPACPRPVRVAYHDACHLAHAQRERSAPRRLLAVVQGVELVEPAGWELCCGSAGIYNLEEPELAGQLGARKVANLLATEAEIIALGNIGCRVQIERHLERAAGDGPSTDRPMPRVLHTVELLDLAFAGALGAEESTT